MSEVLNDSLHDCLCPRFTKSLLFGTDCLFFLFPSSLLWLSRTTCGGWQYPRSDTWWRRLATCWKERLPRLASPGHSRTAPGEARSACLPQEASWLQMEKSVHPALCVGSAVFKTFFCFVFLALGRLCPSTGQHAGGFGRVWPNPGECWSLVLASQADWQPSKVRAVMGPAGVLGEALPPAHRCDCSAEGPGASGGPPLPTHLPRPPGPPCFPQSVPF